MSEIKLMPVLYSAGLNQDQKNWFVDVYKDDVIYCRCYGKTRDEAEENSRKAAAAPEMYEALQMCKSSMAILAWDNDSDMNAFRKLESALAKAEGRQP